MGVILFTLYLIGSAGPMFGQSSCRLEGVWQLVSGKADGQAYPATFRQIKVITKRHFAFLGEEADRGVKAMVTSADSLRAFRTMNSGGGTYTLQGNSYTEKLEYFSDPAYRGVSLSFTCRTEGDRFFQAGLFPIFESGRKVRDIKLEEEWRRIE
jgi:hypothetical protein